VTYAPLTALAVALTLAGCGGAKPTPPPEDRTLQRDAQAARLAFEQEKHEEAIIQYRMALRRAGARDDAAMRADLSFNLAVAELAANRPRDALSTARGIRAELIRRGATVSPDIDLVEATALYRTGALPEADALAATAQAAGGAVGMRASLLRGLIADQRNDIPGLRTAWDALSAPTTDAQKADRAELAARLSIRDGDPARGRTEAEQAADLRRTALDYRGIARALAVAAEAAREMGDMAGAADLYLRAGRSAAALGDAAQARPWLRQAIALAGPGALRMAAEREAKDLDTAR